MYSLTETPRFCLEKTIHHFRVHTVVSTAHNVLRFGGRLSHCRDLELRESTGNCEYSQLLSELLQKEHQPNVTCFDKNDSTVTEGTMADHIWLFQQNEGVAADTAES